MVEIHGYTNWNFNKNTGNQSAFSLAWNHHKHNNPHHPEYWLDVNREGIVTPLPMYKVYVVEMVADWIGASAVYGTELNVWLKNNLNKFVFCFDVLVTLQYVLSVLDITTRIEDSCLVFVNGGN